MPPALNFAPLDNAIDRARRQRAPLREARSAPPRAALAGNAAARGAQREAAPDRAAAARRRRAAAPRLVSSICSTRPGFYTGYGVKTMPGVREGIEQGRYDEAEGEVVRASRALMRLVALVDSASADLETMAR